VPTNLFDNDMIQSPVLIIDDEKDICFLLGKVLSEKNYAVHIANNLRDGLVKLDTNPPAILFLDIRLPDGSGLEALKEIRVRNPHLKIVMMSAYDGMNERNQAKESGADLFLAKPLNTKLIREALQIIQTPSTKN
jgi:DNA-binding response OmpR family regulator